jgi:hypothetical protein
MIRVCFTLLENRIATAGNKILHLQVIDESGGVLAGSQTDDRSSSDLPISASRVLEYNNMRLEACIFYMPAGELGEGIYTIRVLEGDEIVGETQLVLN